MTAYDCSQPLESGMPVYPGDDPVEIAEIASVTDDGSCIHELSCTTHVGTHIDAPAHKIADGPTLDEFDLSAFTFTARVLDCTPCDPRERITTSAVPGTLRETGPGKEIEAILFRTGWSDHWGTDRYRESPYLAPELARWCSEHGLHVGIDTFSPDPVPSGDPDLDQTDEPTDQPAHEALCGANQFIVENLRGLGRLPGYVRLTVRPLPIVDADGSPVRAVATPSK